MPRRKGELGKADIDRGWPHQVALPERLCSRIHWRPQYEFCQDLSLCPRRQSFLRDGERWIVKCFAELEHAQRFIAHFGGEYMTPATRPR